MNVLIFFLYFCAFFFNSVFGHRFLFGKYSSKNSKVNSPIENIDLSNVEEKWFDQYLDQFQHSNTETWKQRYFVNDEYAEETGPVFLQLGGEAEFNPIWMKRGQIAENYAKKFNAIYIALEHRFYGKSHPTSNLSNSNLRYLSSEQALADAANFISTLNRTDSKFTNRDWYVFGGSYSGALAAWFDLKYPHLTSGSVASSAPVNVKYNFYEYLEVVNEALGPKCSGQIRKASEQIKEIIKNENDWQRFSNLFKLCVPFDTKNNNDVQNLLSYLVGNIQEVVQYNNDNRAFENIVTANITINTICDVMNNDTIGNELERFAQINNIFLERYKEKCVDYNYTEFINDLQQTSWTSDVAGGERQWYFQVCTEFGYFQTTDSKNQPFYDLVDLNFYPNLCKDAFGAIYNDEFLKNNIQHTNTFYGGKNLKSNNIILLNGSIDPWHSLGLINYKFSDSKSIFINGTAHCADMYPDSDLDPASLKKARQQIKLFLARLITRNKLKKCAH